MEEILASIRRIIADDDAKPAEPAPPAPVAPVAKAPPKPAVVPSKPPESAKAPAMAAAPVKPAPAPAAKALEKAPEKEPDMAASNSQDDIDAMLAGLDAETGEEEVRAPESESALPEFIIPESMPEPIEDILDLTEAMAVAASSSEFKTITAEHDLEFAEDKAEMVKAAPSEPAFAAAAPMQLEAPLASAATIASVNSAFNALANTVLSNNARTLEDLVREMLRPMLRAWLDDNLPGMVERLVKAEIERVSRGR